MDIDYTAILPKRKTCSLCGRELPEIPVVLGGKTLLVPVACPCELAAWEREKREREYRHRLAYLESYFPPQDLSRYQGPFQVHPGVARAKEVVASYLGKLSENLDCGRGLILFGPPGVGKTHLAARVHLEAQKTLRLSLFLSVPSLMVHFDRAMDEEGLSEWELCELTLSPDLLILDDLGAERQNGRTRERLYNVLSGRYTRKRATILTTNFTTAPALLQHLGARLFDRLMEVSTLVPLSGKSFRQGVSHG